MDPSNPNCLSSRQNFERIIRALPISSQKLPLYSQRLVWPAHEVLKNFHNFVGKIFYHQIFFNHKEKNVIKLLEQTLRVLDSPPKKYYKYLWLMPC